MADIQSNGNIGKQRILSTDVKTMNKEFLESMFAGYYDKTTNTRKDAPFEPTTKITLNHLEYEYVKDSVETTLGMLLMNRFVLEYADCIKHTGYWNTTLNDKGLKKMDVTINELFITDAIDADQFALYIDRRDQLGFQVTSYLGVSISETLVRPMRNVNQRKIELMEANKDAIHSDNPAVQIMTMNTIEKELMGMVRENLKGDYGYDIYASGNGNLDNNYKTINVMRGPVFNEITKKFDVVGSSLMDGITKYDIPAFSNSNVAAAYPSAISTAEAGYMSKVVLALLQSEHIDEDPNSDCGTQVTIPFDVLEKNAKYIYYRYINDNGRKVLFTPQNASQYINKTIRLYSPQCCINKSLCGKCAGKLFHLLGTNNVGLMTTEFTDVLLNLKLKSKHDLSQKADVIDRKWIFEEDSKYYDVEDGYIVNKVPTKIMIPKMFEEFSGFYMEATSAHTFGILPTFFYDETGKVLLSTSLTLPAMLTLNIYSEIQENESYYIISYEPGSKICSLVLQKSYVNCETYLNQIFFYSKTPQLPYDIMVNMLFRSIELNGTDLGGISLAYELLARRLCLKNGKSFAFVFGKQPGIDPMSYDKIKARDAVQNSGILQGLLFEDISTAINVNLANTLNGIRSEETPLEKIIKA